MGDYSSHSKAAEEAAGRGGQPAGPAGGSPAGAGEAGAGNRRARALNQRHHRADGRVRPLFWGTRLPLWSFEDPQDRTPPSRHRRE